jgi:hypothetical protein
MMNLKTTLRNICFKYKADVPLTNDQEKWLEEIKKKLSGEQTLENFNSLWDIYVSPKGEFRIVDVEFDKDFIIQTCKKAASKYAGEYSIREYNIIVMVECEMTAGMTWENFLKKWTIEVDYTTKRVRTKLLRAV